MKSIWLLTETMDYESMTVHSVYDGKPSAHTLAALIKDSYGYAFEYGVIKDLATKLRYTNKVRFLELYTWQLEERALVQSKQHITTGNSE